MLDLLDLLELLGLALMLLEYPAAFFDLSCFDMMVYSLVYSVLICICPFSNLNPVVSFALGVSSYYSI